METADYSRMKALVLRAKSAMGDTAASAELERRGAAPPSESDVTRLTYRELRALVARWRDGDSEVARAESFHMAQRAMDELSIRWRTRSRIGWRKEDAHLFGPEDLAALPVAPWMAPRPPRTLSWKRPMGSTLYPSEADIQRSRLNSYARSFYAAGAPHIKE